MPDERTVLRSVNRTFLSASDQGGYAGDDSGISASGSLTANRFHPEGQRRLVMLVDDDPAMGAMYGAGLLAAGFRVIVLSDVSAIFLTLEKQIPDVAVLDFQLGGILTGVDVLENLRLESRTTHVAALILSNHLGDRDGQTDRAFAAGAFAWLVKNRTSPAELGLVISEALGSLPGNAGRATIAGSSD
jgi:CheY-like chemotaxis protein